MVLVVGWSVARSTMGLGAGSRRRQSSGMEASRTSSTVTTADDVVGIVDDWDRREVIVGHQHRHLG